MALYFESKTKLECFDHFLRRETRLILTFAAQL